MTQENDFSDVNKGQWYNCAISTMSKMGIVTGYQDGTFKPNANITRAEAMTLVNRVTSRLPESEESLRDDMTKWPDNVSSAWYYLAVQEATNSHYYDRLEDNNEDWTKMREARDWSLLEK